MDSNNMYQNQSTGSTESNQQPVYNTVGNDGYNNNSYNANHYGNDAYNNNGDASNNNGYNGAYNYGGNYNNGGMYAQPAYSEMEEPVSVGEWLITMLIMMVPCVNIIMMFVWAFGSSSKKSKSNYFKACLIITGIVFALYLLLVIFAVVAGVSLSR